MFTSYTPSATPTFDAVADVRGILQGLAWPIVNASAYGAVGDGVADDGPALLAAAQAAVAGGAGALFLAPGKTYRLASRLAAVANLIVVGHGATIAGLVTFGSGSRWYGVAFRWGDSTDMATNGGQSARNVDSLWLEDCAFTYTGTQSVQDVGLVHTNDASSQNVTIRACRFACTATGVANGVKVVSKTGFLVLHWLIAGCTFDGIGRMGIEVLGSAAAYGACRDVRIADCLVRATGQGTGASSLGQGVSIAGRVDDFVVEGCVFDANTYCGVELANTVRNGVVAHNTFRDPGVRNIEFSGTGGTSVAIVGNAIFNGNLYLQNADQFLVADNTLSGSALYLATCTQCTVVGNNVEATASGTGALILETCTDCFVAANRIENLHASGTGALQITNGDRNKLGHNYYFKAAGVDVAVSGTGTHTGLSVFAKTLANGATDATYADWAAYTPTFTGFSVNPVVVARYRQVGNMVDVWVSTTTAGTSNATSFTMSLPVAGDVSTAATMVCGFGAGVDNGVNLTTPALVRITAATTVNFYKDPAFGTWTAANGKSWTGMFSYKL